MALTIGLEPTTDRLTADCSTIELSKRIATAHFQSALLILLNESLLCNNFKDISDEISPRKVTSPE